MDLILTLSGNVIISFLLFVSAGSRHFSEERREVGKNRERDKNKNRLGSLMIEWNWSGLFVEGIVHLKIN